MKALRLDEPDPEPVLVAIGEPGWTRRARCADILIGRLKPREYATRAKRLLSRYPGLSLVVLVEPAGRIAVVARDGETVWGTGPSATVATAAYFRHALRAGRLGPSWMHPCPEPGTQLGGPR